MGLLGLLDIIRLLDIVRPSEFVYPNHDERGQGVSQTPFTTEESYVTPRRSDWPVYDAANGAFEWPVYGDTRASMMDLTADEAKSLEIITLFCDYKRQFGKRGTAPVFNYKKTSVIRAEWKPYRIETKLPTPRARAAYQWFLEHPVYRKYITMHEAYLRQKASDPSTPVYIQTARLLLHSDGIEVAARPLLYPQSCYGDSDLRSRLLGVHLATKQLPNIKTSFLRKCLSLCVAYNTDPLLLFLIYDIAVCRNSMATMTLAEQRKLSPEVLADNRQHSEAFWRHEQDYLCDIVRQMDKLCSEAKVGTNLYDHCHGLNGERRWLAYPNVFITIAPAEWMFPLFLPLFRNYKRPEGQQHPRDLCDVQGLLTLHVYNVLSSVMQLLFKKNDYFKEVFEHVLRVEFQERGTLHIHIALWAIIQAGLDLRGTTGKPHQSILIEWLESLGFQTIDIQYGEGFLNYINGYTSKASDCLDFRLTEHTRKGENYKWRMCYRLLCQQSPCVPEIYAHFAGLQLMRRSFVIDALYAPIQKVDMDLSGNVSSKLYHHYLQHDGPAMVTRSFLQWSRDWTIRDGKKTRRAKQFGKKTAIGVRFCFELQDNYICQFCTMFFPHNKPTEFLLEGAAVMDYTKYFVGAMRYLRSLTWFYEPESARFTVAGRGGERYLCDAFPGKLPVPADPCYHRLPLFASDSAAFDYLFGCFAPELANRVKEGRRETFKCRLYALAALYNYIEEDPSIRRQKLAEWNKVHSPIMTARKWSPGQQEAMDAIRAALRVSDANAVKTALRHLNLCGEPGAGKSEVIVHAAVEAATDGYNVLVLCPTGSLVASYRDRFPQCDGIVVETIHSGFAIYRGADRSACQYSPPTRLRRYDLILIDEASQIDDDIVRLVFMAIQELPQNPYVVIAADFAQLNPIAGGTVMRKLCASFPQIVMRTVYRTTDTKLLDFLGLVRRSQPRKAIIESFFAGRHLSGTLREAVAHGLRLSRDTGEVFSWLCVTNKGAAAVNAAALSLLNVSEAQLNAGYPADPKIGGKPIVAVEGLCLRLTRNLDKDRGFVNGAIGTVVKALTDHIFIVRLTTGNLILLHPVSGGGEGTFMPCTYGYATTIRRAQGQSLAMGCLYFDHCYPPERGYGYVGASRFRTANGLYHFGTIRRTDWLPVGGDPSMEQVDRGVDSQASDSDDERQRELDEGYESDDSYDAELNLNAKQEHSPPPPPPPPPPAAAAAAVARPARLSQQPSASRRSGRM